MNVIFIAIYVTVAAAVSIVSSAAPVRSLKTRTHHFLTENTTSYEYKNNLEHGLVSDVDEDSFWSKGSTEALDGTEKEEVSVDKDWDRTEGNYGNYMKDTKPFEDGTRKIFVNKLIGGKLKPVQTRRSPGMAEHPLPLMSPIYKPQSYTYYRSPSWMPANYPAPLPYPPSAPLNIMYIPVSYGNMHQKLPLPHMATVSSTSNLTVSSTACGDEKKAPFMDNKDLLNFVPVNENAEAGSDAARFLGFFHEPSNMYSGSGSSEGSRGLPTMRNLFNVLDDLLSRSGSMTPKSAPVGKEETPRCDGQQFAKSTSSQKCTVPNDCAQAAQSTSACAGATSACSETTAACPGTTAACSEANSASTESSECGSDSSAGTESEGWEKGCLVCPYCHSTMTLYALPKICGATTTGGNDNSGTTTCETTSETAACDTATGETTACDTATGETTACDTATGETTTCDTATGETTSCDTATGETTAGDTTTGETTACDTATGETTACDTATGETTACDTATGETTACDTTTGETTASDTTTGETTACETTATSGTTTTCGTTTASGTTTACGTTTEEVCSSSTTSTDGTTCAESTTGSSLGSTTACARKKTTPTFGKKKSSTNKHKSSNHKKKKKKKSRASGS